MDKYIVTRFKKTFNDKKQEEQYFDVREMSYETLNAKSMLSALVNSKVTEHIHIDCILFSKLKTVLNNINREPFDIWERWIDDCYVATNNYNDIAVSLPIRRIPIKDAGTVIMKLEDIIKEKAYNVACGFGYDNTAYIKQLSNGNHLCFINNCYIMTYVVLLYPKEERQVFTSYEVVDILKPEENKTINNIADNYFAKNNQLYALYSKRD